MKSQADRSSNDAPRSSRSSALGIGIGKRWVSLAPGLRRPDPPRRFQVSFSTSPQGRTHAVQRTVARFDPPGRRPNQVCAVRNGCDPFSVLPRYPSTVARERQHDPLRRAAVPSAGRRPGLSSLDSLIKKGTGDRMA
jgi:hypothetical protein